MQYYRLKYRLCMQHSYDGKIEHKHHHVIELETISRPSTTENFTEFSKMERILKDVLDPYQNRYLNECEEFGGNTTIENIGEVCYRKLDEAFSGENWMMARFEISETPLRVYAIVAEEY